MLVACPSHRSAHASPPQAASQLHKNAQMLEAAVAGLLHNAADLVCEPDAVGGGVEEKKGTSPSSKTDAATKRDMKMRLLRGSMSALEVCAAPTHARAHAHAKAPRHHARGTDHRHLSIHPRRFCAFLAASQVAIDNELKDLLNAADVRNFFEDM